MSVSTYKNNICDYHIGKLENVVYLINSQAVKDIHIDNGDAYIDGLDDENILALPVYDVELSDTDELDERYKFTHTLKFSMYGYANYLDFQAKFYAIVKSVEGVYWLVNPLFPCKVSYTFTLDSNGSHTDFTLATASNHPTLKVNDLDEVNPYDCGYKFCKIGEVLLNETMFSLKKSNNEVLYTNDGFKYIEYIKNSGVFTENFDGNNVHHNLTFNIKFSDYKSSWHYNLLEFIKNKYAAVISMNNAKIHSDYDYRGDGVVYSGSTEPISGDTIAHGTECNCSILVGFYFGLQPSFTVNATDDMEMDYIQIQLSDVHDNGSFISCDAVYIHKDSGFEYDDEAKECLSQNLARYLLKREIDAKRNPTGRYLVLEGYESEFPSLNIIGTFDESEVVTCTDVKCKGEQCVVDTTIPSPLIFTDTGTTQYTLRSDTDWSITSSGNITVSPSNGYANQEYTISITNSQSPQDEVSTSSMVLSYCNTTKTFDVSVTSCFTAGRIFRITADEQYVVVPHKCCIQTVEDQSGLIMDINIQDRYFKVFVPENDSGAERTLPLDVEFCDGTHGTVQIIQEYAFVRWVKEGEKCVGRDRCDIERKYTGQTSTEINTWTDITRLTNCRDSLECGLLTRWVDDGTICDGIYKYKQEKEQSSIDYGESWQDTGVKRKGERVPEEDDECSVICSDWRVDGYICEEFTKYEREREWQRRCINCDDCEAEWLPTSNFRKTDTIIEEHSRECGYDPCADWCISASCVEWRSVGTICDGCDKYEYLRQYFRICEDCSDCDAPWTATDVYKKGNLIEEMAQECGCVDTLYEWRLEDFICEECDITQYRWYTTETICKHGSKFAHQKRQYSTDGITWIDTGEEQDLMVEYNSSDCNQ